MTSGFINIALGGFAVYAGLTGRVLVFTHSSEALVVGGVAIAAWGCFQIFRNRRRAP